MTEKEKLMIAEKIKKSMEGRLSPMPRIGLYDEAIDTIDETAKRLNQPVSDINEKHEDS